MTHLEFWTEYAGPPPISAEWVVFENGTIVFPGEGDSAEDVLSMLHDKLLGGSGAGSPYGDFSTSEVVARAQEHPHFHGHIIVSYNDCVGPVMSHCHRSELGESADIVMAAGLLCRKRRNQDAAERVRFASK